jgi:RimJ/RimL family protein N-acetyltransferase
VAAWLVAAPLVSGRLCLTPLRAEDADEAFPLLDDARLHSWTGGTPPSRTELRARFRRQAAGRSPDGTRGWLNWMVRRASDTTLIGTVQATLARPTPTRLDAEVAWVIGTDHQGQGYAREAALTMARWLRAHGVDGLRAHIHPQHHASMTIARVLDLTPTTTVHEGEILWTITHPT